MFYKLDGKNPVRCASGHEWVEWFENAGEALILGQDEIDGLFVLTVFTGIDQSGSDEPELFETLCRVDGKPTGTAIQYTSYDAAYRQHRKIVLEARAMEDA